MIAEEKKDTDGMTIHQRNNESSTREEKTETQIVDGNWVR